MNDCILILVGTPAIEGTLVDWLLQRPDVPGFTAFPVCGHGAPHHLMNVGEQVEGRQSQVLFWLQLPEDKVTELLQGLKRNFAHAPIHYWVLPVLACGRVDQSGK
jgi:hypothetical protein